MNMTGQYIHETCLNREFQKSKKLETAKVAIAAFRNTLYANSLLIKNEKI